MADKKEAKGQVQPMNLPIVYTQEEMEYREDLQQKLLTLEHVKSILIGRDDSPVFLHHINDLSSIVKGWYANAVYTKQGGQNEPPAGKGEGSEAGSGTSDTDTPI